MKIVLFGAKGRVGSRVRAIAEQRGHTVVPLDKEDCADDGFVNNAALVGADVAIDFSLSEATSKVCEFCKKFRCPLVSGVTGRTPEQQQMLDELAKSVPTCVKSNFSVGVQTLTKLVSEACKLLYDWDCEIVEIHRKDKRDSPSGTAKNLAAIAAQRKNFCNVTVHSLRCGSNFGRHSVIFAAQGESLELTHQAENTDIFARGAVLEAEKLVGFAQNVADGKIVGTVDGD